MLELKFRTLRGEPFELTIDEIKEVKDIKDLLETNFNFVPSNVRLINGLQVLTDETIIDPNTFKYDKFIVIYEEDQSLRKNITISKNIKTSFAITRKDSEPAATKTEMTDDFQEMLKSFQTMGFDKARSLEYLRRFNYDYEAVITYFISGVMPSEDVEEEFEEEEDKVAKEVPKPAPKPREYDVSALWRYNFGTFTPQIRELNNKEQYALLRVLNEHRNTDVMDLVQYFLSCSNDYTTTTHLLEEMGIH